MKTTTIFLLVLILISCTTDNLDIEKSENILVSSKNGSQTQIDDLYYGLDRISYLVGRVLLKHVDARNQVATLLIGPGRGTSTNTIDFTSLLDINNSNLSFKIAFDYEESLYEQYLEGGVCCGATGGGVKPIPQERDDYFSLSDFINENCFELYFPTTFGFNPLFLQPEVNITPHPLADNSWPTGMVLWQNIIIFNTNNNEGYYMIFDNFMLNNPNVIVVRPKRTANYPYDNVPVADFTTFFDIIE